MEARASSSERVRKAAPVRPRDLIYAIDELPPLLHLALLGFQHVAVICPYLVFVTLIVQAAGAPVEVASSAVSLGMLAVAIATLLQAYRVGPVGSGYLIPPVVSAIYFAPALHAARGVGLPVVFAMTAFAGAFEMLFAWILPRMRHVFPPVVSGFIVMAVGAELGLIGVQGFLGVTDLADPNLGTHVAVAFATLAIMISLGVWGGGLARLLCGLIGLVVGVVLSLHYGMFTGHQVQMISECRWIGLPSVGFLSYRLDAMYVVPFAIGGLASGLRTIGVVTTAQKINDSSWRRPDLNNVRSGVLTDGLACAIGGLLGASGLSASPSLIGIEKVTGATSRYIAWAIAAWLVALAMLPKVGAALLALPLPVVGAALLFNGASMLVGGIQIIASRPFTMRSTFVVGISFLLALSRVVYPQFYHQLPDWTGSFTDSILSIAVISCVLLNLVFLIGERRTTSTVIESLGAERTEKIEEFLRARGKAWEINHSDVERAVTSVDEIIHILETGGHLDGPLKAKIEYDDLDLVVGLKYSGSLPYLPSEQDTPRGLVEEQIFAVGLSGYLSSVYPDRLDVSSDDRTCEIKLYFQT